MASLQTRLGALITAIGADIKLLQKQTILTALNAISDTEQADNAVEWRHSSTANLLAKLVAINPIESAVIVNRSELWARVKTRDGTLSADRLILDSDGNSGLAPVTGSVAKATDSTTISTEVALSVSASITVEANDAVLVWANARGLPGGGTGANGLRVRVYVDSTLVTSILLDNNLNTGQSQHHESGGVSARITGLSAGAHTLALKAVRNVGTSTANSITAEGTAMSYMVIPGGA